MDINDLTGIGRLGGRDDGGYYHLMLKPGFKSVLPNLTDCFLIFSRDRVFYVTITDHKLVGNKVFIRFAEPEIDEERRLHKEVTLAIVSSEIEDGEEGDESFDMESILGFKVIHNQDYLGIIEDYFHNGAQYVLVIKTTAQAEVMIPYVEYFVEAVVYEMNTVFIRHATDLIEL